MNRKLWKRRVVPEGSQGWRAAVQGLFLALNVWIGLEFLFFVRGHEGAWVPWVAARPAGVEGWLPIAGMMNTRYFLETGRVPDIHPAAMVLILTFFALSVLFRKAFCGWMCPVGAVSERLWKLGKETFGRNFYAPKWLDLPLRSLKYALFCAFLYAVLSMHVDDLSAFLRSPYGLIADVKMLNFFRFLSAEAAIFVGVTVIVSIFVPNAWCRYLCPYGALMGLGAIFSPARITRVKTACIDCGKCAKACPSRLPVDQLVQIRSAECLGCMECVTACPAEGALGMTFVSGKRMLTGPRLAAGILVLFAGAYLGARVTGHWESDIPDEVYKRLVPLARELDHPR